MSKSIELLIEHQTEILQACKANEDKPEKVWDSLRKSLPRFSRTMTFSTFKQYLSVFIALHGKLQTKHGNQLSKHRYEKAKWLKECSLLKQTVLLKDEEIKLDKSQLSKVSQKIHQLSEDFTALQLKMNALIASLSQPDKPGRNIAGWTVRLTSKGYYHLCKSFGGNVKSIYLGKVLDEQKARQKITDYLSKLG